MFGDELARTEHDIPRFCTEKAGGVDVGLDLLRFGGGEALQRRKALKQRGRHHIDARVRALCRKPHRKQQLVILFVIQRALRHGIFLLQQPDDLQNLLLCAHTAASPFCVSVYKIAHFAPNGKRFAAKRACKGFPAGV